MYDVCIIGAGPAGLSVLSALHNAEGNLTDSQWNQWNCRSRCARMHRQRQLSVCVIDPSGCWLNEWNGRFRALNIEMLRSPAWATPDSISSAALVEFAWKEGRQKELYEVELTRKATKDMRTSVDAGLFQLPGSKLFKDFCAEIAETLPHTMISASVQSILRRDDGTYEVSLTSKDASAYARHVVFALGAAGSPRIPTSLIGTFSEAQKDEIMIHTNSWEKISRLECKDETIVVIGGGLSSVQAALLAVRLGAHKVYLMSRRPLQSRHYDLPLDWMDPRSGWRSAAKDKNTKNRLYEYYATPVSGRRNWVQSARGGATVPSKYLKDVEEVMKTGRLRCIVDEVLSAEICERTDGKKTINLKVKNGPKPLSVDRVILATGSKQDVGDIPLLQDSLLRYKLPIVDGLPVLDENLQWGEESFYVVGSLALLQIGPDSGNLTGCRRCAEICAYNFGAFEQFEATGGPLTNIYEALSASQPMKVNGNSTFSALNYDSD